MNPNRLESRCRGCSPFVLELRMLPEHSFPDNLPLIKRVSASNFHNEQNRFEARRTQCRHQLIFGSSIQTIHQPPNTIQTPSSEIRRRIEQHHRIGILVRHDHARRSLEYILQTRQLVAHGPHVGAELPVRPRLVDGVPLLLVGEVRVAKVVALARRDEVEAQGPVGAEGAGVGVPVEAAGGSGVAGGLELGHAWIGGLDALVAKWGRFWVGCHAEGRETHCSRT